MSDLTDFATCNNLTVNSNLVVGNDVTMNNLVSNDITSNSVYVENIILKSEDLNGRLLTSEDDLKVLESSVNNLTSTKADITYVNTQIANLIGGASESYDTLVEIQTLLQEDETQIDTLFSAVGLRALDTNTVHKNGTETITGSKQFDAGIILNSNLKANDIDITPLELSRLHSVVSDIQPQINTLTTGVSNLQPQQTSISATTVLNDNYRSNCWFVITASTSINVTLPNPTNNIGKVFWFTNQSPSACNIIGNGSNTIKLESNVGVWSSVASISITPNATLSLCCKSGGYVILYNSYVASQLNSSTNTSVTTLNSSVSSLNTSVSTLNTKSQMISFDPGDGSTVISKPNSINTPTLRINDNTGRALYFLPNASNDAYNYLTEANDSVIAYSDALSIVPYINSSNGIRMTKSLVKIGSTSSQPEYGLDNCITFNGTARTITLNSPNWVTSNQALFAPDFYLSGTNESISNIIGNLRNADTTLTNNLTTETTNRTNADTTLTNAINTEIQDRQNGDTTLGNQYAWAQNAILDHVDYIDALETKTQKITYDATNNITKFASGSAISTSMIKFGNTATPQNLPVMRAWGLYRNDTGLSSGPQNSLATLAITRINTGRYGVNLTGDAYTTGYLGHVQVQLITRGENGYGAIRGFTSYVKHVPVGSSYTWEVVVYGGGSNPQLSDADFTICIY
jgi:hypothetical protein